MRKEKASKGDRQGGSSVIETEISHFHWAVFGFRYIGLDLGMHACAFVNEHLFQAIVVRGCEIGYKLDDKLDGVIHGIASRAEPMFQGANARYAACSHDTSCPSYKLGSAFC
jgi:hypothetical protein